MGRVSNKMINEKVYDHRLNFFNGNRSTNQKVISNIILCEENKVIVNSGDINYDDLCLLKSGDWNEKIALNDITSQYEKLYSLCKSKELNFSLDLSFNSRKVEWISGNSKIEKKSIIRLSVNKGKKDHSFIDIPFVSDKNQLFSDIDQAFNELICERTEDDIDLDNNDLEVIMSPKAAGYFIHEIIGHPVEKDIVDKKQSFFSQNDINTKIMPDYINIIESPEELKQIGYDFGLLDDVENRLNKKKIIENGVLKNFIEYKRCSQFRYPCINRMHNLVLRPNENGYDLNYIIEHTKNGIVIDEIIYGCYNIFFNQFILYCGRCRYIKNGEVIGYNDGLLIKDELSTLSEKIVEIGNDFKTAIGMCAKQGQTITVGMGAPTMKLRNINVQKGETLCF